MQKGFNSQVPRTCKLLPIDKCQTKACQLPQFASAKKLKNSFHFTSATQKPVDCFNSSVPKTCNLLPIHKCHTKACKLLQFTSVRKTCKMLTTHNLPVPRFCKLLQFFAFHSQVPNNGLQTALIHKCQEPCTVPVNLQYALPCYAAPCYICCARAMLHRAMLHRAILRRAILRRAMMRHAILRPATLHHATSKDTFHMYCTETL